ncbi:uncharacterized protein SPSK_08049 [Sporothrix schenckii 1099-18]|uniref:Uncharacterized protein n=1 Tax=Sporothrix schenckii 1099-18 TaxID=1397361 RepID=A0A0F2MDV2_SPOSC|nr:uncharacterized protein SPSK_08049 [Sporothrix schenckii 1099-18]KJR87868.1 hypothetical protein SPSK_08049 [Sporothrix schenckii 1099-18]
MSPSFWCWCLHILVLFFEIVAIFLEHNFLILFTASQIYPSVLYFRPIHVPARMQSFWFSPHTGRDVHRLGKDTNAPKKETHTQFVFEYFKSWWWRLDEAFQICVKYPMTHQSENRPNTAIITQDEAVKPGTANGTTHHVLDIDIRQVIGDSDESYELSLCFIFIRKLRQWKK